MLVGRSWLYVLAGLVLAGCSSSETTSPSSPTLEVGQVWYVQDHAYRDDTYHEIIDNGSADKYPAQTTGDQPDQSFHFIRPYPCTIDKIGESGFYHCTIDSEHQIDQSDVWSDHLMTKEQADAASPGSVLHKTKTLDAAVPAWARLQVGQKVYTGYDGGDATSVTMCVSVDEYLKWANGDMAAHCTKHKPGLVATITSVKDDYSIGDGTFNSPIVGLRSADGSWAGYTSTGLSAVPIIPPGSILRTSKIKGAASLTDTRDGDAGVHLAPGTRVEVVRMDPREPQNATLFVRVLDGTQKGRTGWLLDMDTELLNGDMTGLED
jgi:hypothetical protein